MMNSGRKLFAAVMPFRCNQFVSSILMSIFILKLTLPGSDGFRKIGIIRIGSIKTGNFCFRCKLSTKNDGEDIWTSRRKIIRAVTKPLIVQKLQSPIEIKDDSPVDSVTNEDDKSSKKAPTGVLVSAFLIAISAAVLRLGGRSAFVSMLGLDFITDSGIKTQVNDLISNFQSLDGLVQYLAFFAAWFAVKLVCFDALTVILALSSGVLFGGIIEGTVVSVLCSSIASLCVFYLARYFLREQTMKEVSKRPALRAVERAVAKEGFKTVFTLRLSPLIPIPIAAYNYLYGVTSVSPFAFFAGISLGSIKPYLLDSYLGLFGKSIIDGDDGNGVYNDVVLLAFISVLILVGTFATQVAAATWEEIQNENKLEEMKDINTSNDITTTTSAINTTEKVNMINLSEAEKSLVTSPFFVMSGITATDYSKWPNFIKSLINDIASAQNRVKIVIDDEVSTLFV